MLFRRAPKIIGSILWVKENTRFLLKFKVCFLIYLWCRKFRFFSWKTTISALTCILLNLIITCIKNIAILDIRSVVVDCLLVGFVTRMFNRFYEILFLPWNRLLFLSVQGEEYTWIVDLFRYNRAAIVSE